MARSLGQITDTEYSQHGGQAFAVVSDRVYASGHRERTVSVEYTLSEVPPRLDPLTLCPRDPVYLQWLADDPARAAAMAAADAARKANQAQAKLVRAARSRLRRKVYAADFRVMLTLTALEVHTDGPAFFAFVNRFIARVRRHWPAFDAITVLELQERGALHAHCAIPKPPATFMIRGVAVKSYDVLRQEWEHVIGGPGRVRVGHREPPGGGRTRKPVASASECAAYLAKYLGKNNDEVHIAKGHRRFRAPIGIAVPPSVVVRRIPLHLDAPLEREVPAMKRAKFGADGEVCGSFVTAPYIGNSRSWYLLADQWLDDGWSFKHVRCSHGRLMYLYRPPPAAPA